MIKIFRKIRFVFIKKKNTISYLKYAGGEIILVVIGILIALQINNFNENRKDRLREQIVLKQLKEDYLADREQLDQKIRMREVIINSAFYILEAIDHPENASTDSLLTCIAHLCMDPTFDPIQNNLFSSDNFRLITNEKLKRMLSNYSSDVVAVKEVELIYSNKVHLFLNPFLREIGITRNIVSRFWKSKDKIWLLDHNLNPKVLDVGASKFSHTMPEITSNKDIEAFAAMSISLNTATNLQSETLLKRIDETIMLLQQEIMD